MKKLLTMFAVILLVLQQAGAYCMHAELQPDSIKRTALRDASKTELSSTEAQRRRIAADVYECQPKRGWAYAYKIADYFMESARRVGVHPYAIAAMGHQESKYDMRARSQVGIMQFTRQTWRDFYGRHGMKILDPHDNIVGGGDYFSRLLPGRSKGLLASRGGTGFRNSREGYSLREYSVAWKRYNGGGDSRYVSHVLKWYRRLNQERHTTK